MNKLFVTLYVIVVLTIFLLVIGINFLPGRLLESTSLKYLSGVYNGTFVLLDDYIEGEHDTSLDEKVLEIKQFFRYPVELLKPETDQIGETKKTALENGEPVIAYVDNADYVCRKSRQVDRVWCLANELNVYEDTLRSAQGTFELFQRRIKGNDESQILFELEKINNLYDFPIRLIDVNDIDFTEDERTQLLNNQLIVRDAESAEQYFMRVRGHDKIIHAGPLPIPWIASYLVYIVLGAVGLFLAIGLFAWMWPLWRDLKRLRFASAEIATGNLETRVEKSRVSLINSIIDGFNDMAGRTQDMVSSQKELTNAVSHELRTPIARLKFGLQNLKDSQSTTDRERHLVGMEDDVNELSLLVEDLLVHARYEHGLPDSLLQHETLDEWLLSQIERTRRQDLRCSISLEVDEASRHQQAWFEPNLLARAISNGLQNASKHAEKTVVVRLSKDGGDNIIHIDDDGPGVPQHLWKNVFEPFTRLDESRNRDSGGYGLGLPIVDKVASWHGGRAAMMKAPEGGARLEIRWPDDGGRISKP